MNTSIVVSLDTRRAKKDGSFPLVLRLTHRRSSIAIPVGVSIHEQYWDENARVIKKSYPDSPTRLNNQIQKKKSEAMDVILKSDVNGLSVKALKEKICAGGNISFAKYTTQIIDGFIKTGRIGNARCYKGVLSVVKTFGGDDVTFDDITFTFLNKFETEHLAKGNSINSLSVYLRTIRAIYNKAMKEGIAERDRYPFQDYKIKSQPTEKRALDIEHLKKIVSLRLKPDHKLFNARNYFLASYMMYGMNFTDMAFLRKSDISNGRITYRRKKTSKLYDIKVTDKLKAILSHYQTDSIYLFPILHRSTPLQQSKDIQWARKRYNKKLKDLAKLCCIEQTLTSYVSRHSFATQAMMQQVPLNAISTMLGHSSLKTTEIYLKSLPSDALDQYNSTIIGI